MDYNVLITIVKAGYALALLSYFSLLDYKYRDIPDKLVWGSLGGSIVLLALSIPNIQYQYRVLHPPIFYVTLLTSVFVLLVLVLMYFYRYMGGADVLVLLDLLLLFPLYGVYNIVVFRGSCPIHLSPIIIILLYASLMLLLTMIVKGLWNIARYWKLMPREAGLAVRLALAFIGRPVRINDYLRLKHYYPLEVFNISDGRVSKTIRLGFSVEEEYYEHQETIRSLVEKGIVSGDDFIWVTFGIPFLIPLLAGFIVFLLFGDYPLMMLMGVC